MDGLWAVGRGIQIGDAQGLVDEIRGRGEDVRRARDAQDVGKRGAAHEDREADARHGRGPFGRPLDVRGKAEEVEQFQGRGGMQEARAVGRRVARKRLGRLQKFGQEVEDAFVRDPGSEQACDQVGNAAGDGERRERTRAELFCRSGRRDGDAENRGGIDRVSEKG